jgi:hypothetical protein
MAFGRPTATATASPTSPAATQSATTGCGVPTAVTRHRGVGDDLNAHSVPAVLGHGGDEGALSGCGQRVNGDDRGDGLVREARRPPRSLDAAAATDPHDASVLQSRGRRRPGRFAGRLLEGVLKVVQRPIAHLNGSRFTAP